MPLKIFFRNRYQKDFKMKKTIPIIALILMLIGCASPSTPGRILASQAGQMRAIAYACASTIGVAQEVKELVDAARNKEQAALDEGETHEQIKKQEQRWATAIQSNLTINGRREGCNSFHSRAIVYML